MSKSYNFFPPWRLHGGNGTALLLLSVRQVSCRLYSALRLQHADVMKCDWFHSTSDQKPVSSGKYKQSVTDFRLHSGGLYSQVTECSTLLTEFNN
jgi:hypothetical protein